MGLPKSGGADISSVQNFISSVTNGALVRATGADKNRVGAGGFLFDIVDQEEVAVEAEITDHYVENNVAVQDHIALRPMTISVKGFMGELNDISLQGQLSILTNIESLGDIGGLAPEFGQQAAQVYSKVAAVESRINSVLNQAANIYDIFNPISTTQSRAQKAFSFFQNLWKNGLPCTVETPFGIFSDMYVLRLTNVNRGETKIVSDFSVMFKQIRKVSIITQKPQSRTTAPFYNSPVGKAMAGRASDMVSPTINKGNISGSQIRSAESDKIMRSLFPLTQGR